MQVSLSAFLGGFPQILLNLFDSRPSSPDFAGLNEGQTGFELRFQVDSEG
jgi:hypothetical protein